MGKPYGRCASLSGRAAGILVAQLGSAVPGGNVTLSLSLAANGGAQPSRLQWTLNYPAADVSSVTVAAGASTSAAGKSVT